MTSRDPITNQPLPADAIQRILYVTPKVHVYAVPPLTSNKGYTASQWTTQEAIFTARLRVLETAIPAPSTSSNTTRSSTGFRQTTTPISTSPTASPKEKVTTTILLEDPSSGALFAAAPYIHPSVVAACIDSSRFFAIRVVGDGGRKATLGIGFEERPDAFDFNITLQDAGKLLGFDAKPGPQGVGKPGGMNGAAGKVQQKKDYSLKEGETISVNLGENGRKFKSSAAVDSGDAGGLFAIQPPPGASSAFGGGNVPMLAPPPSAADVRRGMRPGDSSVEEMKKDEKTAEELGFDDGEFGEFQ